MAKKKEATFEENLNRLEEIVGEMESGDANLTELIEKYSEGVSLSKKCMSALKIAGETMDLLIKEEGAEELKLEIEGD
ncbi:MAG: exodeoxyribonuclease VII small subunit [Selenomonadaceae bacterium]|nr:exodeoxyribonuclease VII small subunit [Selenomonadaceae bacterium]